MLIFRDPASAAAALARLRISTLERAAGKLPQAPHRITAPRGTPHCAVKFILYLGMTHGTKSSVFFNIVQRVKPMFKKFCRRFCIIMDAIWQYNPQYNPQHKCSKRGGGGGGIKGRFNNVKKNRRFGTQGRP